MFIQRKNYLRKIARVRVSEGRDLDNGLRLDRNEKVDVWSKQMMADIFMSKPDWFLSVYPESTALYEKVAKFHAVKTSEIMLTSGIDGGIKTLYEVMTEPGDLVGVVGPTYAMYMVYPKLFQLQNEEITYTSDLKIDFKKLHEFLERRPTMFFLPNPNQPIESSLDLAQLEELARKALANNTLFVIDEAYHMFGAVTAVELMKKYENVVILRTFSKGFGVPSIRLGYMMSNEDNMSVLGKTRFAHESNTLSNAVAEHLLDNYGMVEAYNKKVMATREELKTTLPAMGIPVHGIAGNYLLLDLGDPARTTEFVTSLREQKIYIKGPWTSPWDRYATITLGPIEKMSRFLEAARAFCAARQRA